MRFFRIGYFHVPKTFFCCTFITKQGLYYTCTALCVANGNELWGFKTNKSKVLYFCLKDTENRIQDRLEGMPGSETDNLLFMYDAPNMDNGFDTFLRKIVKEEPGIKLVIVWMYTKKVDKKKRISPDIPLVCSKENRK